MNQTENWRCLNFSSFWWKWVNLHIRQCARVKFMLANPTNRRRELIRSQMKTCCRFSLPSSAEKKQEIDVRPRYLILFIQRYYFAVLPWPCGVSECKMFSKQLLSKFQRSLFSFPVNFSWNSAESVSVWNENLFLTLLTPSLPVSLSFQRIEIRRKQKTPIPSSDKKWRPVGKAQHFGQQLVYQHTQNWW